MAKYNLEQVFDFLREIKVNNNLEWMNSNRKYYEAARDTFKALSTEILNKMILVDPSLQGLEVKNCIFRFNRDTRFSNDKAPYKRHFGMYMVPGGKKTVGAGYYLHIQPADPDDMEYGQSLLDFGLYAPPSKAAKIIREEIFYGVGEQMTEILQDRKLMDNFSFYSDDLLKVLPKNLKNSPYDDLIRRKNWDMFKKLSDEEVLQDDFVDYVIEMFRLGKPWNDAINNMLDGYDFQSIF
ncbi:MAG: DUF2461 domain-containing protein [Bacteroidales bacterium]|nr:DUF2461 domain-containing protein [Bacteroidales bacterium]